MCPNKLRIEGPNSWGASDPPPQNHFSHANPAFPRPRHSSPAPSLFCPSPYETTQKKIPGAVLDGGIFDGCSFYAADLTGCSLKDASLRRCNLSRARLGGLDLGALPALRPFGSCTDAAAGDGAFGSCGSTAGGSAAAVTVADEKAREEMIGRVQVSADGALVAVLSGDGRSGKVRVCVCMCVCTTCRVCCVFSVLCVFSGVRQEVATGSPLFVAGRCRDDMTSSYEACAFCRERARLMLHIHAHCR